MVIANVVNPRLLANRVVEVHGAAAGDEKDVAHAPIRELADNVVGELHERRSPKFEFWQQRDHGIVESETADLSADFAGVQQAWR